MENIMKKIMIGIVAFYFASFASAYANEFNLDVQLGAPMAFAPPVVVAPSPAYVVVPGLQTYDPYHRRGDWRYWHERREYKHWEDEHREHEHWEDEHREHEHWEHDHRY
jgi:hypothetical protein